MFNEASLNILVHDAMSKLDYYVNYCQIANVQKKWVNFVDGISRYVHDNSHLFTLEFSFESLAGLIQIHFLGFEKEIFVHSKF